MAIIFATLICLYILSNENVHQCIIVKFAKVLRLKEKYFNIIIKIPLLEKATRYGREEYKMLQG